MSFFWSIISISLAFGIGAVCGGVLVLQAREYRYKQIAKNNKNNLERHNADRTRRQAR